MNDVVNSRMFGADLAGTSTVALRGEGVSQQQFRLASHIFLDIPFRNIPKGLEAELFIRRKQEKIKKKSGQG